MEKKKLNKVFTRRCTHTAGTLFEFYTYASPLGLGIFDDTELFVSIGCGKTLGNIYETMVAQFPIIAFTNKPKLPFRVRTYTTR